MTTELRAAILRQPAVLEQIAAREAPDASALTAARRVVLVGTGTSFHAAELGAALLGTPDRAAVGVSSQQLVRRRPPLHPDDVMIALTHTGSTAYTLRCMQLARKAGAPVIVVTGQGAGLPGALETVPLERSETYSVSYLAVLALLARLASAAGVAGVSRDDLRRAAASVRAVCDTGAPAFAAPPRSIAVVGSGLQEITAREGALKLREASRQIAVGYDAELFLHGSAVPYGPQDALLLLGNDEDGFLDAVARAAEGAGLPTRRLAVPPLGGHPVLDELALTAQLQLMAEHCAQQRAVDPDTVIAGAWADDALWAIGRPAAGRRTGLADDQPA